MMTKVKSARTLDYRKLSASTVAKLAKCATRIRAALERSLVEVGRELTEANKILAHGQFAAWVERETGLSIRTAQLIMSAFRLCLKNENFSRLGRSALFVLGASDVPASAIAAVSRQIATGRVPRYVDTKEIVRAAKARRPGCGHCSAARCQGSADAARSSAQRAIIFRIDANLITVWS